MSFVHYIYKYIRTNFHRELYRPVVRFQSFPTPTLRLYIRATATTTTTTTVHRYKRKKIKSPIGLYGRQNFLIQITTPLCPELMQEKLYNNPQTSLKRRALCNDRTEQLFFLPFFPPPRRWSPPTTLYARVHRRRRHHRAPWPTASIRGYRSRTILIVYSQIGPNPAIHVFLGSLFSVCQIRMKYDTLYLSR